MLVGERGKFLSMVAGVFFAAMIITQQSSIFMGILSRTFSFLTDTNQADIWVMDPKVQFVDDIKPLQSTKLLLVRGISGVDWAEPLYKGIIKARLPSGTFQSCNVIGIDDATLLGGPSKMVQGNLSDLRRADSVIVDEVGAKGKLATKPCPTCPSIPLKIGDILELNDRRAYVVGISSVTRTFQSQPVIHTTYSRATNFAPQERKQLSFIMVKAKDGVDKSELTKRITAQTGLAAYTREEFIDKTRNYFLKYTGIPINFGISVLLGFVIGTAIAGQSFFSFTTDNLKYFGTLKAMGATGSQLTTMVVAQAIIVGMLGYGLGIGVASQFYYISLNSELAFKMIWQIPIISCTAVVVICVLSALLSIRKVIKLEPAIVFRS